MKFFFDANLSPNLAHAIAPLSASEEAEIEVIHKFDLFKPATPDVDWMDALGTTGPCNIISHDRFTKNRLEVEALRRHGFTVFMLKKGWAHQTHWPKSAQLIRWWPRIIEQAGLVTGGGAFFVPFQFSGRGRFETIRL